MAACKAELGFTKPSQVCPIVCTLFWWHAILADMFTYCTTLKYSPPTFILLGFVYQPGHTHPSASSSHVFVSTKNDKSVLCKFQTCHYPNIWFHTNVISLFLPLQIISSIFPVLFSQILCLTKKTSNLHCSARTMGIHQKEAKYIHLHLCLFTNVKINLENSLSLLGENRIRNKLISNF